MSDYSSRHHADGRLKGQTRQRSEIQIHHIPESSITDLDESYRPQDIVDALTDIRFGRGPGMLRIDAHVRDYLVSAVKDRIQRR
jgi:hypothetical protein